MGGWQVSKLRMIYICIKQWTTTNRMCLTDHSNVFYCEYSKKLTGECDWNYIKLLWLIARFICFFAHAAPASDSMRNTIPEILTAFPGLLLPIHTRRGLGLSLWIQRIEASTTFGCQLDGDGVRQFLVSCINCPSESRVIFGNFADNQVAHTSSLCSCAALQRSAPASS